MKNERMEKGWQEHPGTYTGHYFRKGEQKSLCNRVVRHNGETAADSQMKCAACERRRAEAFTPQLS